MKRYIGRLAVSAAMGAAVSAATLSIENKFLSVAHDDSAGTFCMVEKASGPVFLHGGKLDGTAAASDPGWNVEDASLFTAVIALAARKTSGFECVATSIRQSDGEPLGSYRWLVWAVTPITYDNGENTHLVERQVIPAANG
jgi:hypothetical protein